MAARLPITPSTSIYSRFINTRPLSAADVLARVLRLQPSLPGGYNTTLSRSSGGEVVTWLDSTSVPAVYRCALHAHQYQFRRHPFF
jgi:hypothetical protein